MNLEQSVIKKKKIAWSITMALGLLVSWWLARSDDHVAAYFEIAEQRSRKYKPRNKDLVIVVDYRKNIFCERLYVLDMRSGKVVLSSRVSHAYPSGIFNANAIGNVPASRESCSGNFITGYSCHGRLGYSMKILGQDKGINDSALVRGIIFHMTAPPFLWSGVFLQHSPESTNAPST